MLIWHLCSEVISERWVAVQLTGVPVVIIEYDGTTGLKNEDVIPYLKYRERIPSY
jgi:hypothetical protein